MNDEKIIKGGDAGNDSNGVITFMTVRNVHNNHFFQSFLACTPKHPIIDTALRLTVEYYEGKLEWMTEGMLIGPHILYKAYEMVTGVNPTWIGKEYIDEETIVNVDEDTKSSLRKANEDQERVYSSTFILQEGAYEDKWLPNFPTRQNTDLNCDVIVHDKIGDAEKAEPVPYFYSRIIGSSHCEPKAYDFCGDGAKANGMCLDRNTCCSKYGWCGTTSEYCSNKKDETPTCGNGKRGNGMCQKSKDCCSNHGWCGDTSDHCSISTSD